jgi:hypothetical protein
MAGQSPCTDLQRSFNFGWAFIDCEALSRRAKVRMHGRHAPTLEERRACCLAHEMLDDLDEGMAGQASRDECENFLHMFCDGKQGRPKVMTARVELAELRDRIVDVVEGFASTIREMKLGHDDEGYNTLFVHILHPEENTRRGGDDDDEGVLGSMGVPVKAEAERTVMEPRVKRALDRDRQDFRVNRARYFSEGESALRTWEQAHAQPRVARPLGRQDSCSRGLREYAAVEFADAPGYNAL